MQELPGADDQELPGGQEDLSGGEMQGERDESQSDQESAILQGEARGHRLSFLGGERRLREVPDVPRRECSARLY